MKTLAWRDLGDTRNIYYIPKITSRFDSLFRLKRHERNKLLLQDIRHTGNIGIYLLKGNKMRLLFTRDI